jgi:hypothetical protein
MVPPFSPNASYNVPFRAPDGPSCAGQIEAINDMRHRTDNAAPSGPFQMALRGFNGMTCA